MNLKEKQIPVIIILISILLIIYTTVAKTKYTNEYEVEILFFNVAYLRTLLFLLFTLGAGIFLFLFKDDKDIKAYYESKFIGNIGTFSKAAKEWLKLKFPWKRMSRRDIKNELKVFSKRYMIYLPLLLPVTIFLFLLNYWQKLNESTSHLNVGEAFFLSYGKTFFIIALITGGIGLIKIIAGTGKNQTIRRRQVLVEEEKANESFPITKPLKTQVLSDPKTRLVFEKTEIISLCAVVIFTFLSWVFFSDIFLLQETYESILSINIYNKVLAGEWNLGVGESALFKADLSLATMQEFYGSDAPNVFVGLAVFFAFLFFARHVQNKKENRKKVLLVLTGAIVVITTLNFAFVEYTDIKRNDAIQYFYDTAEDLN